MDKGKRRRALIVAAVVFLSASRVGGGALAQQATPDPLAARVDALFADFNRAPSPGLALAVVRDGKVLLRRGYGLASIEHRAPITPSTVFDAASVAKQFTGLAVAMLVAEGKLKLSDDIRTHVPEFPDLGRTVTVAHLLHHTSGLRDWPGTLSVGGWRFDDVISYRQILTMAYNQRGLNFDPGAEHFYSNTGYNLLAEIVQRVTKRPFRAWTDERIFRPLGMVNTHFRDDHTEVVANRASGYARSPEGGFRNTPNNLAAPGSSSLFTTADDLARWVINFDDAAVGGRAAMSLMLTRGALNDGTAVPYAFGVLHGSYRGLPMFTHSGSWASFNSYVVYFPQQKFGVAILANSNRGSFDAQNAVIKITNIYMEKELAPESPPASPPPAAARVADVPAATLDEYAGLYRLGPGWFVRVTREGASLSAQATREGPAAMSARSEREFWVEAYGASMVFQRGGGGRVTHLEYRGLRAPKVDESGSPAPSGDYAGDYESEELGTTYRVVVKEGALEMQHRRHGPVALARLWRDEFGSPVWFMKSVEFRRDAAGRVNELVVNGDPRSRDIRFTKRR